MTQRIIKPAQTKKSSEEANRKSSENIRRAGPGSNQCRTRKVRKKPIEDYEDNDNILLNNVETVEKTESTTDRNGKRISIEVHRKTV